MAYVLAFNIRTGMLPQIASAAVAWNVEALRGLERVL